MGLIPVSTGIFGDDERKFCQVTEFYVLHLHCSRGPAVSPTRLTLLQPIGTGRKAVWESPRVPALIFARVEAFGLEPFGVVRREWGMRVWPPSNDHCPHLPVRLWKV